MELNEVEKQGEMKMVEIVEQGEEVEQQLHDAGPVEGPEEMIIPTDREVEEADVNTEEPRVKATVTTEAEQPVLTAEEVERHLAATVSEAERMELDVEAQEFENGMTVNEEENPTERAEMGPVEGVETNTTVPEKREVVIVTDEEDETEKVLLHAEIVQPEAEAVVFLTYQGRPARDETSEKRFEEEQPRQTLRQKIRETVESPTRSTAGVPRRRRRLIIVEEPEDEEDVFFSPMDARPSQVQPDAPYEANDSERERRERKREGEDHCYSSKEEAKAAINNLGDSRGKTESRRKRFS
ncbi:pharyngeal muscle protein 2-like [Salvia splendens]|uniref:pharyngeal muscle protein 2-like n=1 Tax=Salvia splendens TaxID=180675 RepID=UPI001C26ED21|nr:pharyngeal muscle protein 2-like [Salvia splendens]